LPAFAIFAPAGLSEAADGLIAKLFDLRAELAPISTRL
jgi:hypothetical protein